MACVLAPQAPMKTIQRLRLISAPGRNGMVPRSCSKADRSAACPVSLNGRKRLVPDMLLQVPIARSVSPGTDQMTVSAPGGGARSRRPALAGRPLLVILRAPFTGLSRAHILAVVHRACQRAGIPQFGAHRLRHAVACDLLRRGATLAEVGQLLRHRDERTTARRAATDPGISAWHAIATRIAVIPESRP